MHAIQRSYQSKHYNTSITNYIENTKIQIFSENPKENIVTNNKLPIITGQIITQA